MPVFQVRKLRLLVGSPQRRRIPAEEWAQGPPVTFRAALAGGRRGGRGAGPGAVRGLEPEPEEEGRGGLAGAQPAAGIQEALRSRPPAPRRPGGECGLGPRGRGGAAQRGPLALLGTSQRLQRFSGSAGGAETRWAPLGWAPLPLGFSFITCEMGASVGPVVAGPGKGGRGARDPS